MHWTNDLAIRLGERKPLYVFVKCFTKFVMVKSFTIFFIKDFVVNGKYFTSLTTFYIQTNTRHWENIFWKIFYFKTNGALETKIDTKK